MQVSRATLGAPLPLGFLRFTRKQHGHTVMFSYRENHKLTVWNTHTPTQGPQRMIAKCELVSAPTAWCRHTHRLSCPPPHRQPTHTAVSKEAYGTSGTSAYPCKVSAVQTHNAFVLPQTQNHPLTNCDRHANCCQTVPHSLMQKQEDATDDQMLFSYTHTHTHGDTNSSVLSIEVVSPLGSMRPLQEVWRPLESGVRGKGPKSVASPSPRDQTHGASLQQTHRTMPNMTSMLPSSPTAHTAE